MSGNYSSSGEISAFSKGAMIFGLNLQNLSDLELVPNAKNSVDLGQKQQALIG